MTKRRLPIYLIAATCIFSATAQADLFSGIDLDRDTIVTNCDPSRGWQEGGNLLAEPQIRDLLRSVMSRKLSSYGRSIVSVLEIPCVLQLDPRNAPSEAGGRALMISTKKIN